MRPSFLTLATAFLFASNVRSDEVATPDLGPLLTEVRKVVEKHYPKATVSLEDQTIRFEFNTRKFMIHEPLLTGEWQDAYEDVGPQKGGIVGEIEFRSGQYGGMAVVPQSSDKRYFTLALTAPYSKKLDFHLYVRLKYPRDVPKEFLAEFERLMNGFEKHVSPKGK
jgi:hypothetical protein